MKTDDIDTLLNVSERASGIELPPDVVAGTDEVVDRIMGEWPWFQEEIPLDRRKLHELQTEYQKFRDLWQETKKEYGSHDQETLLAKERVRTLEFRLKKALEKYES